MQLREISLIVDRDHDPEPAVRRFVLSRATSIRLTVREWTARALLGRPRHYGGNQDPLFQETYEKLLPYLQAGNWDETKYWNILQTDGCLSQHLTYRLSPYLKQMLDQDGLVWGTWNWGNFYGLEDPTFYRDDTAGNQGTQMVASVISHEPYFQLWVTQSELDYLLEDPQVKLA